MINIANRKLGVAPGFHLAGLVVAMLMLIIAPMRGQADDGNTRPFSGYTKYLWYRSHYEVNADGTDTETHDWALKVLSTQGITEANQSSFDYSGSLQDAEIVSAYTLKAHGRRINVPQSNFQEQINKGKGEAAPMFSDVRTKAVAFPDVAVGDTVVMSYKIVQKEAMFPGNFSVAETLSRYEVYDSAEITIGAPSQLDLHIYQRGVQGGEISKSTNGRRNWRWTYRNEQVAVRESGALSELDDGPLIVASTFKDYGAVAAAYNLRAQPKAAVTLAIKNLADELTKNIHGTREQAGTLYDWVAANIDYAGDDVGVGQVVPHAAEVVLANRMGDCKDHSILLEALLAAKGIASTSVLINAGNSYSLPPVASADAFNHMISYIPALNLYADSTSRFTAFRTIPFDDADKPVVRTTDFTAIQRTPASTFDDNRVQLTTKITIDAEGAALGATKVEQTGFPADEARERLSSLEPDMQNQMVQRLLGENGFTGTGNFIKDDPHIPTLTYSYGSNYRLTDAFIMPGPAALTIRSPFSGSALSSYVEDANEQHTVNFQCYGVDWKEQYTVVLPHTVKILAIPRNVVLSAKNLTYRAKYESKGQIVTAIRELEDRTPGNVCTPDDAAETKEFARGIRRDLQAQVLYQ